MKNLLSDFFYAIAQTREWLGINEITIAISVLALAFGSYLVSILIWLLLKSNDAYCTCF